MCWSSRLPRLSKMSVIGVARPRVRNTPSEVMWSVVMWSELTLYMWSDFILKWSEVSYVEVLGDKSTVNIRVTLYWGNKIVLWIFYLICILYCGCFNLFCNMWCACMCGFCNVWMCVCVGVLVIMCTSFYCVFVFFMYLYSYLLLV
jgi:hypothetical protein